MENLRANTGMVKVAWGDWEKRETLLCRPHQIIQMVNPLLTTFYNDILNLDFSSDSGVTAEVSIQEYNDGVERVMLIVHAA